MTYAIGQNIEAATLSARHIGEVIQFYWEMDGSKISAKLTGELRQVYHTSVETTISVTSHTEDAGGEMSEFTIDHGHNITLMVKSS